MKSGRNRDEIGMKLGRNRDEIGTKVKEIGKQGKIRGKRRIKTHHPHCKEL